MGSLLNRVDEIIGGALKKVSHYLYPKGEALKRTERMKPLCFFRRRQWQKRLNMDFTL